MKPPVPEMCQGDSSPAGGRHDPITRIHWRPAGELDANFWNPNVVFNPELRLLEQNILRHGWIQPLLVNPNGIIIDGFHRWRLSLDSKALQERYHGMVPCVVLEMTDADAMLLTVRMNRARGTHVAGRMAQLVQRLLDEHRCTPEQIAAEIGATADEVALLSQKNVFKARNLSAYKYSKAWTPIEDDAHSTHPGTSAQ